MRECGFLIAKLYDLVTLIDRHSRDRNLKIFTRFSEFDKKERFSRTISCYWKTGCRSKATNPLAKVGQEGRASVHRGHADAYT